MSIPEIVAVGLGLGLGTLAFRLVFAGLWGRWSIPTRARAALEWVPVAALAALVSPAVVPQQWTDSAVALLAAALVTCWATWWTRNLFVGVGMGMALYWTLAALL